MWIIPARRGLEPSVEQRSYPESERRNQLRAVLVPAPGFGGPEAPATDSAVTVHQDAAVYASLLDPGVAVRHRLRDGFLAYFFVVHGEATIGSLPPGEAGLVDEGGAAKIAEVGELTMTAGPSGAEILLVEVPPA
jgi:redox-sensitive bicupin YhaK (pirin superfamily)